MMSQKMELPLSVRHLLGYITWLLYLAVSYMCILIRYIIWWKTGLLQEIQTNRKPENFHKSAHKMTIIFQHRLDGFIESRLSDSILMHHSFISPEYVLRDDVHIMQITDKEVIFVQLMKGAKGPDAYPFAYVGYTTLPKHIITTPLASFNRLVDGMEKNDAKIIFLQNQARCGGTLFTEVFKATGFCITFGEPHVINGVVNQYYIRNKWDREMMVKILRNVILMQCKPGLHAEEKPLAYVIKPNVYSMVCADLIQEALPDVIQFFIYRDPIKCAISIRRVSESVISFWPFYHLPSNTKIRPLLLRMLGYYDKDFRGWTAKISMAIEWGYRLAGVSVKRYMRYRDQGIRIHGIRYSIFRDNQEALAQRIFEICGLPSSLALKASEAFKQDSQKATPLSQESLNTAMPVAPKVTPAILQVLREMSEQLGVPGPDVWKDDKFTLPGTVMP